MSNLATWLRAQLDDDERQEASVVERVGRALAEADQETFPGAYESRREYYNELAVAALKAAGHDPARVGGEIEAKRQIIAKYEDHRRATDYGGAGICTRYLAHELRKVLCLLALSFDDRPDYLEEWREEPG